MTSEVANNAGVAGEVAQADGAAHRLDKWAMLKTFIFRMMFTYFVFSLFRRNPTPAPTVPGQPSLSGPSKNMFLKNDLLDMYVYLTPNEEMPTFGDQSSLFWHLERIKYGNWEDGESKDGSHTLVKTIKTSQDLMNNGSLYIHVFMVKPGFSPDPKAEEWHSKQYTMHVSKMLTRFRKRRISRTVNLLTGLTDTQEDLNAIKNLPDNATYLPPVTHWHPNLTINLIDDFTPWTMGSVPSPLNEYIKFYPHTNQYYPALYLNDYWNLNEEYMPVNSTTPELQLRLTYAPLSLFKWQMYLAQSMRKSWYSGILGNTEQDQFTDDEDQDTFKKTVLETNPYLLGITIVVSIVHSVFEMLAFKNDIQFWKSRESFEGLSIRSVFFNIFQSVIVMLYVFDNDTNFVVKVSVLIGMAIEIWKVKKVVNVEINWDHKILGVFPCPKLIWQESYVESETKTYDQMAFKYLSWALFPLLAAYAGYSLIYQEHRGWYSWVLSMLYGFLLTFGFIAMTPQLFINYKLKSVAHLPWRMLTYKALNTFIDDLFAFVIKTPTLYRIGCLRDDVIFFIYLYQRWIYRMDPKRVNEFGVSEEMLAKRKEELADKKKEGENTDEKFGASDLMLTEKEDEGEGKEEGNDEEKTDVGLNEKKKETTITDEATINGNVRHRRNKQKRGEQAS